MSNNGEFNSDEILDENFLATPDGMFLTWAHGLYQRELDLQSAERTQRSEDAAFYDGSQFADEELEEYERRNQKPRTFNEIKPTVDWLIGGERRTRADWAVLPRTEDDSAASLRKTKLVKYIDDINNAHWHRSDAFSDMVKTGEGWTRVSYEKNQDGDFQIQLVHEHWRYIISDSNSRRRDMSDMQYLWCIKVLPIQTLINNFPDKKSELKNLSDDVYELDQDLLDEQLIGTDQGDESRGLRSGSMSLNQSSGERSGVKVYEMWYKVNERVQLLRGAGSFNNEVYDENNNAHKILVEHYGYTLTEVTRDQIYCAMYTDDTVLYRQKSPYKHNRIPFVRRFAYLKDRNGAPYGVIRSVKDPQSDLNIRRNRALFLLSSSRVIMDEDAVEDERKLAEEVASWDGIIKKKKGYELRIEDGAAMANAQINVGEQNSAYIRQISGVTGENRGMDTNATSGIAIQSRQEQGTIISTVLTDMNSLARKMEGELVLSMIEQFMDKKFQFRITADNIKDKAEFVKINDEADPETDITKTQADFIVSERDYRTTMRQALSEQLISVAGTMAQHTGNPALAVSFVVSAIEMQDLPDKERFIEQILKSAGLPPLRETDEQKQQREENEMQAAQQQQQKQQQAFELEMKERLAKVAQAQAIADKAAMDAELIKVRVLMDKIQSLKSGMEAGAMAVTNHNILPVVDQMIDKLDALLNMDTATQQQEPLQPNEQEAMQAQLEQQEQVAPEQQQIEPEQLPSDAGIDPMQQPEAESI